MKMDWQAFRKSAEAYSIDVKTRDIIALLNSRDAAVKGLTDILAECPKKPIKPFCKRIKELAQTAKKEAEDLG